MLVTDLGDLLATGGAGTVGSTAAWGIYLGRMPESPDRCITVYETGGVSSLHTMSTGPGNAVLERPRAQVVVRAPEGNYSTGREKIQEVVRLLDGLRPRMINTTQYYWAASVQSPFVLDRDANERIRFVVNFDVAKALSTA